MNDFEKAVAKYIGIDNLKKIQHVKVGIAGAGGLGSNCAFNLVRSGFRKFKIVDFDYVEYSNLDRQFFFIDQVGIPKVEALKVNLERINPDIEIADVVQKITEDNIQDSFEDCDIIVEAFDKVLYKKMLVESYYSSGKFFVSASGLAGWGKSDDICVKKIHSKFYLVGDLVSEVSNEKPPISPRVNIVAAKQADVILNYVLEGLNE